MSGNSMQYNITTSKGSFLLVEVPEGSSNFELGKIKRNLLWFDVSNEVTKGRGIKNEFRCKEIPEGHTIVALVSEALLSEDIAGKIIDDPDYFSYFGKPIWTNYHKPKDFEVTYETWQESIESLLSSNNIPYTTNQFIILKQEKV